MNDHQPPRHPAPAMTSGRAALILLMDGYLRGFLEPFVSLLELHKLMYFMQEAGQPLRLQYRKAPFGPYAENLRHVLHAIEGHYVVGYRDGGDDPCKPIELVPAALEEAQRTLRDDPQTMERLERVMQLVAGFESAFGLELLSTVHWIQTREPGKELIPQVYAWGPQKQKFTPRQINLAAEMLAARGWF